MRKNKFKILMLSLCILTIFLLGTHIASGSIPSENDKLRLNNPYYTGEHDPNTNPQYKANNYKEKNELLSKSDIMLLIKKNQIKKEGKKVKSIELKTYKEHILEDDPGDYSYNYLVDENRMVWVIITEYSKGLNTKNAYYNKATTITVLDAEIGDFLKSSVTGDVKTKYKAPGSN